MWAIRIDVDAPPAPVLYLQVRDDGVGASPEALNAARSWGVMGMRERAAHFGGRLGIESWPDQGTTVRLDDAAGSGGLALMACLTTESSMPCLRRRRGTGA